MRREPGVGVVDASRVVVSFPEPDRSDVRREEDSRPEERVEGRREDGRHHRLHEQHGRVGDGEWLRERVEGRAPRDLPRGDVRHHELHLLTRRVRE